MTARLLIFTTTVAATLTLVPLLPAASAHSVTPLDLLEKAQAEASEAASRAWVLRLTSARDASWQGTAEQLESIKHDVLAAGQALAAIDAGAGYLAPLERQAIRRAFPLLKQMAGNTGAAIRLLNANQAEPSVVLFSDSVGNLASEADQFSKSVAEVVQLARTRTRELRLEKTVASESAR